MRHRKKVVKLGRMSSHRNAMLNNMASSILLHKKIYTTLPKAKAIVPLVDKLITWAKTGSLHCRRLAFSILKDRSLVKKLFTEIVPTMAGHNGGYTRIMKTGTRVGDGASMAIIELIGQEVIAEKDTAKNQKKEKKPEKQEPKQAKESKKEKIKEKEHK